MSIAHWAPVLSAALLACMTTIVHADSFWSNIDNINQLTDPAKADTKSKQGFSGNVSLGYLATSGNTDTTSLNSKALLGYVSGKWKHALKLQAIRSTQSGATTAESYEAAGQSDYHFTQRNYVFGALDYLTDRFSGYERKISEAAGIGRRLLDTDTMSLDVQAGLGARQTRLTDGTDQNGVIGLLGASYAWNFSETGSFTQNVKVETGKANTYLESVTALNLTLVQNFALSVSYTVKRNSNVPVGKTKTDTATAVSLVYGF